MKKCLCGFTGIEELFKGKLCYLCFNQKRKESDKKYNETHKEQRKQYSKLWKSEHKKEENERKTKQRKLKGLLKL